MLTDIESSRVRNRYANGESLSQIAESMGTYCQRLSHYIENPRKADFVWTNVWVDAKNHSIIKLYRHGEWRADVLVDTADKVVLAKYRWRVGQQDYIVTSYHGIQTELHRVLWPVPQGMQTDFINRSRLDYRKENLRHTTHSDSLSNQPQTDAKVHRSPKRRGDLRYSAPDNKWEARINKCFLGRFKDEPTARRAIDAAYAWFDAFQIPKGEELLKWYEKK